MTLPTENSHRGIKKQLSICQFLLCVRTWWVFSCWGTLSCRLHSWVVPVQTSSKTGTALIAITLVIRPQSECKRWNWRITWRNGHNNYTSRMDGQGSNNKRQRRDWHGHARARWWRRAHFASGTRGRMLSRWWFATVYDTDCWQPLEQTHGCLLWSSGNRWCRWCRWFLDTSGRVLDVAAVVVCQWLHHVRLWLTVGGFGLAGAISAVPRGKSSPVSKRRFASARSSRCSTLKRQSLSLSLFLSYLFSLLFSLDLLFSWSSLLLSVVCRVLSWWLLLSCVYVFLVVVCACGVVKLPCVHSKRPRVYRHHARMWQHMRAWRRCTRGRFECTHGAFWTYKRREARGGSQRDTPTPTPTHTSTPTHCTPTTHNAQHTTQNTQSVIANSAYQNLPTQHYHLTPWILHTFSLRIDRKQHVPESSNHSHHLIKLFNSCSPEEHCGWNQPPDGSICVSPPKPTFHERFARHSTMISCVFCYITLKYIQKHTRHHESSRTPQHSKWNCVGAHKPQHSHM